MKAVDTNVILRFLTVDDSRQSHAATEQIRSGVFVPHSVLMEAEWVLRSGYGWSPERINGELSDLVAMQCVEVDQIDAIHWALDRHRRGADWADMLHLIAAGGHSAFSTFDRKLPKSAGEEPPLPVELLK
jgi:predicted nucleic-acid-binding protein